jgi:hypothetical protein
MKRAMMSPAASANHYRLRKGTYRPRTPGRTPPIKPKPGKRRRYR